MTLQQLAVVTTDELIAHIVDAEPGHLNPDIVQRCLDLLVEAVLSETAQGRSVAIADFGEFSLSDDGIRFVGEPTDGNA